MQLLDPVPRYISTGQSFRSFGLALRFAGLPLQLDYTAILHLLSFQYLPFDLTIDKRIRRVYSSGHHQNVDDYLTSFPQSDKTYSVSVSSLVEQLKSDLQEEFDGVERVTVLLSGGLDSRIAYAALQTLRAERRLDVSVRAVTWGREGCADVETARSIARIDDIECVWLPLGPDSIIHNLVELSRNLGPLVSPVHLHAMPQLASLKFLANEPILVGSLGNGVVQGEFLWRHVSYCRRTQPQDWLGVLQKDCEQDARSQLLEYLNERRSFLEDSCSEVDAYEREMLVSYNQNLLLFAYDYMRQRGCRIYQAYSSREFYSIATSVLPFRRSNRLRLAMLRSTRSDLAKIPAVRQGRTSFETDDLGYKIAHDYESWIAANRDEIAVRLFRLTDLGVRCSNRNLRRALDRVGKGEIAGAETGYVLLILAALAEFLSNIEVTTSVVPSDTFEYSLSHDDDLLPPWGFASRPFSREKGWDGIRRLVGQQVRSLGLSRKGSVE